MANYRLTNQNIDRNKAREKKTLIYQSTKINKSKSQWFSYLLGLIMISLVIIAMLRWILSPNSETLTFTKLLQFFVDIQNYQINIVNLGDFTIIGDWGIFDGLRNFINMIMSIINLGVWLAQSIINILITTLNGVRLLIFG